MKLPSIFWRLKPLLFILGAALALAGSLQLAAPLAEGGAVYFGNNAVQHQFNPTAIPGLIYWVSADQGTYSATSGGSPVTTDGTSVLGWHDLSGNGNNFIQATGGSAPVLKTALVNGRNIMRFNSTSWMASASTVAVGTTGTLFCVIVPRAAPTAYGRYMDTGSGQGGGYQAVSTGLTITYQQGSFTNAGTATMSTGSGYILTAVSNNNGLGSYGYMNGARDGSSGNSGATTTPETVSIGQYGGGAFHVNADFCEILYYSPFLSFTNQNLVQSYLAARWGITVSTSN